MIQVAPSQLIATALIDGLKAVAGSTWIYDSVTWKKTAYPYVLVHHLNPVLSGPPLLGGEDDYMQQVQVDAVGQRRDQAQAMADRARGWMHSIALSVPGWVCARRETQAIAPVQVAGQPEHELFTAPARYGLTWTPSS